MSSPFFTFQQGSDTRSIPPPDSSLRYGRFRAFSPDTPKQRSSIGNLFSAFTGDFRDSLGTSARLQGNYGSVNFATEREVAEDSDDEELGDDRRWWVDRLLLSPRRSIVKKMVGRWWSRWVMLILLPACISIAWCAIPFPTSPLDDPDAQRVTTFQRREVHVDATAWSKIGHAVDNVFDWSMLWDIIKSWWDTVRNSVPEFPDDGQRNGTIPDDGAGRVGGPGHGSSQVVLNIWFFITVYYGFYNLIALLWITKIFNMYSLNWWPPRLGFPPTFTFFNLLPLGVAVILYYFLPGPLITQNLTWIFLTFSMMCCPLLIAFLVLIYERRNNGLGRVGRGLSEAQMLFSNASPATGRGRRTGERGGGSRWRRRGWWQLPRSYKRFFWFCSAVFLSLIAFVLGEAYAELYLRSLPHNSLETVIYVWSWVLTIHILDLTTGWIVGARVNSYPLGVVFKLYFNLTYQTYVRALYARLRSPKQFVYLQLLSSSIVVIWSPITMTKTFHSIVYFLKLNGQTYEEWRKTVGRSFFVRGLAENISMVAWLGWVLVLHYGYNTKIYPYFAFNKVAKNDPYTFSLTFWASLGTWGAEIVAGWIVRRIMGYGFGFLVTEEGIKDLGRFPELMPAVGLVAVHVLQNMLFSIVRLRFY